MKALILCAGYATRLYPLTKDQPKHLLPIAGKPMLNYAVEKINQVNEIDSIYVITNKKFYSMFQDWASKLDSKKPVKVFNDNTDADSVKLGAIGDMKFVLDQTKINDDLLVMAGDNLFELKLPDFISFFRNHGCSIALKDVGDKELMKQYSEVNLDKSNRVISFIEKPPNPKTTLAAICMYLFPKTELNLVEKYINEGNNPDQPGRYVQWLSQHKEVYGYVFSEPWYDIGDLNQYNEANRDYVRRKS
jgi:glucose-1-phosphate thymidylyltransferase